MNTPVERRAHVFAAAAAVNFLTVLAIIMALLTIVAVLVAAFWIPDNMALVPTILGIASPIIMALLAAGLRKFATVTDGQMGEILKLTQEAKKAEGVVEGIERGVDLKTNGDSRL